MAKERAEERERHNKAMEKTTAMGKKLAAKMKIEAAKEKADDKARMQTQEYLDKFQENFDRVLGTVFKLEKRIVTLKDYISVIEADLERHNNTFEKLREGEVDRTLDEAKFLEISRCTKKATN